MKREATIQSLKKELKFKDFELSALLEITKGINTDRSIDELLSVYEFILKERLGLQKFVLYIKQDKWTNLIKTGVKGKIKNIDIERDLLRFKKVTLIEASSNSDIDQFDVVIPVYHQEKALAFLLLKETSINKASFDFAGAINELSFIETLTNIIV